jgi:hypothetical protein
MYTLTGHNAVILASATADASLAFHTTSTGTNPRSWVNMFLSIGCLSTAGSASAADDAW